MLLRDLDLNKLSRLLSQQVDHVTCIECCKYYTVPTTASCGHTLCHSCWRSRRNCASCGKQIEKKNLKLNISLQNLREHVSILSNTFENLFNIKLEEFLLDSPAEIMLEPNKNVKEWLASSQNQFSAPVTTSTQSTQEHVQTEQITSDIHIHTTNNRLCDPREVVHVPPQQDDWDKIEEMPEAEKNTNKNQKNLVGPMDIEPFEFMMDDEEYTSYNPRRSSRQKDNKTGNPSTNYNISPQRNSEDSNKDSEKKFLKAAKNWNNVKRMKKEFSKLNKQNRNKLNVSIEMCKRNVNVNKEVPSITPEKLFSIDDNTPEIITSTENNDLENNNDKMIRESINEHVNKNTDENSLRNTISAINKTTEDIADVTNKVAEAPLVPFIKKSTLQNKPFVITDNIQIKAEKPLPVNTVNNDDIEITIKIGNTLTNICIKKKDNDVQLKINSEREVQTSLENCSFNKRQVSSTIFDVNNLKHNSNSENIVNMLSVPKVTVTQKSFSKKNTDSADTTTAQLEITESIEREMTKSLDFNKISGKETNKKNLVQQNTPQNIVSQSPRSLRILEEITDDIDMDIFDGESEKVESVKALQSTKNTPSAILPSLKTRKLRTPLTNDKRDRDQDDVYDQPSSKKLKLTLNKVNTSALEKNNQNVIADEDRVNDETMGQFIDNVDNYMENLKNERRKNDMKQVNLSQTNDPAKNMSQIIEKNTSQKSFVNNSIKRKPPKPNLVEKYSENIFSVLENDSEILKTFDYKTQNHTQHNTNKSNTTTDLEVMELCTPVQDDDSDKSVVEDTPQKSTSFTKKKNKNETTINNNTNINITMKPNLKTKVAQNIQKNNNIDINVISLSDSVGDSTEMSKNITVLETEPGITLETPVTITKFVDQITHKSTPMARKSLNFNNESCDPELTICPSSFVLAQTTQEREFLSKAFEHTLESEKCIRNKNKVSKFCLAGSCLSAAEQSKVRILCSKKKWSYVEKYTKDLTHLVVCVDEENKSKRSVKYMCALAGGKWIISYEWIEKCLETNDIVDEEQFEALDDTGGPGPRRSRLAKQKLFTGISFYCMPPFSVLDVDTLKDILVASGGRVVSEPSDARAGERPVLLLAEPEHTQEDRFIYLAMELSVVPVNYEWVLNCLGSYSLDSIFELLLCPSSLLPPVVAKWPPELISRDE